MQKYVHHINFFQITVTIRILYQQFLLESTLPQYIADINFSKLLFFKNLTLCRNYVLLNKFCKLFQIAVAEDLYKSAITVISNLTPGAIEQTITVFLLKKNRQNISE